MSVWGRIVMAIRRMDESDSLSFSFGRSNPDVPPPQYPL